MEGRWQRSAGISLSYPQAQTSWVASNDPNTLPRTKVREEETIFRLPQKGAKVQSETFFFSKTPYILLTKAIAWGHGAAHKGPFIKTGYCL